MLLPTDIKLHFGSKSIKLVFVLFISSFLSIQASDVTYINQGNCIDISSDTALIAFSQHTSIFIDNPPFAPAHQIIEEAFRPYGSLNLYEDAKDKANKRYWLSFNLCNNSTLRQRGYLSFGRFDRVFVYDRNDPNLSCIQKFGKLYKSRIENKSPDYNLMPINLGAGEKMNLLVHISAGYHMNIQNAEITAAYIPRGEEDQYLGDKSMLFKQGVLFIGILIFISFLLLGCVAFYFMVPQRSIIAFSAICLSTIVYFSRGLEVYFQEVIFWSQWDELMQRTEVLFRGFITASFILFILIHFKFHKWKKLVIISSAISITLSMTIGIKLYFSIHAFKAFTQLDVFLYLTDIYFSIANSLLILGLIWKINEPDARTFVIGTASYLAISYGGLALNLNFPGLATTYFSANMIAIYGLLLFLFFMTYLIIKRSYHVHFRFEKEMIKSNQINRLNESTTKLYTNITHELRTPLTIISGLANKLEEGKPKELIQKNSNNLLGMINQILDLSKLESGVTNINEEPLNLIEQIHILNDSYYALAAEKNISLNLYSELDSLHINGDKEKLKLILGNIITNAIKYTPTYGKILVILEKTKKEFIIKIKDNGKGITAEKLENIFDRYYQISSTDTLSTGIGLSIVKELVQLLGGTIHVESKVDAGSTFYIKMPLNEIKSEINHSSTRQSTRRKKEKIGEILLPNNLVHSNEILLVEDNPDLLFYINDILKPHYNITTANRGSHGLDIAIQNIPDLIISDVMMPGMSGFDLCNHIRTNPLTSHIPIILLTAKADKQSKLEGLKSGADAYLRKPFDEEELIIRINGLLENKKKAQLYYQKNINGAIPAIKLDPFLVKVFDIIDKHIADESFGIPKLCRELHLERTQVYRKIKAITGTSASVLIQNRRMEKAQQLIKEQQLSVTEIAEECGFSDPNYFSKVFKKSFGKSPSFFL